MYSTLQLRMDMWLLPKAILKKDFFVGLIHKRVE